MKPKKKSQRMRNEGNREVRKRMKRKGIQESGR